MNKKNQIKFFFSFYALNDRKWEVVNQDNEEEKKTYYDRAQRSLLKRLQKETALSFLCS